jgi:hypothetical protein
MLTTETGNHAVLALTWDPERSRAIRLVALTGDALGVDEFDGSTWHSVTASGATPPARIETTWAWDGNLKKVVLFGGLDVDQAASSDTWSWDGQQWQQLSSGTLTARSGHAMAWNPSRNKLMLFGGQRDSADVGDTWEWDGSTWQLVPVTGPSARQKSGLTYSTALQSVVLLGGYHSGSLGDTWAFDSTGNWSMLASGILDLSQQGEWIQSASLTEIAHGQLVAVGGFLDSTDATSSSSDLMLTFDGKNWPFLPYSSPSWTAQTFLFGTTTGATVLIVAEGSSTLETWQLGF